MSMLLLLFRDPLVTFLYLFQGPETARFRMMTMKHLVAWPRG